MLEQSSYSPSELIADGVIHALGLAAVTLGIVLLCHLVLPEPTHLVAAGLYILGLAATFAFSAAYNLAPVGPIKSYLRRLDHAAIFVMIAGTYTPVALLAVGGTPGTILLVFVWSIGLLGAVMKIVFPGRFERLSFAAYLILGWAGLLALFPMMRVLTSEEIGFLALGGILYSAGAFVHLSLHLRYHNAIWHAFVVSAAACHYWVILQLVTR